MRNKNRLGLIIDGVDIFDKWGINVKSRDISKPNKKKALETVAHSSNVFDFSELYGGDNFEERTLTYVLNIIGLRLTRTSTEFIETQFNNFLMSKPQFKLIDEIFPGYYFLAEVRNGADFNPIGGQVGELTVVFHAYPFRIKATKEGSLKWDDYSILDVYQETKFFVPRTTFKPLAIGSIGTVGAWSIQFDGLEAIPKRLVGTSYTITEKRTTEQGFSSVAYYFSGLNKWVIEQDVVQAQNGNIQIELLNNGSNAVTPTVIVDRPITILRGNEVYNVWAGSTKDELFQLNEGINYLTLSAYNSQVQFDFYKELI